MKSWYEFEEYTYLLAKACKSAEEKQRLDNAYEIIQEDCENSSCENSKYGLVCSMEATISASSYYRISELIPRNYTIVDCGCGIGLQQVFFNNHKKYIGIDILNNFIKISTNSEFIHGDILEVLPSLKIENECIGISILCGSVWEEVGDAMKSKFEKVIII